MFDFANILFAGPCNARCPYCIGQQIDPRLSVNNLDVFPPRNLDHFVSMIREHNTRQVVFSGTTTDPQLYHHEAKLLDHLRAVLPAETQIALHTNGRLALKKIDTFNRYDRVCLSLPSFDPDTYREMLGVSGVPDLAALLDRARVPIKISCVVDKHNCAELPDFLGRCHALGIQRIVLRHLYGHNSLGPLITDLPYRGDYRGNAVYDYRGMEITEWDFDQCESTSLNLFSTGVISTSYLLAEAIPD